MPTQLKPPNKDIPNQNQITWSNFLFETIKTVIFVSILALIIRTFLLQPFIVDGRSMEPNYHTSDYLLIDKLSYRLRDPKRGEVVVFQYPKNHQENYIKRIIGLPGETVVIENGEVKIVNRFFPNGQPLAESYLKEQTQTEVFGAKDRLSITLGPDEYFVLGDNRGASSDSRVFGAVSQNEILGRSFIRPFPLNQAAVFAHEPDPLVE